MTKPGKSPPQASLARPFGVLWRAAALLGVGAGLGFSFNALRPAGVEVGAFVAPVTCSTGEEHGFAQPSVRVIPQAEAASLCASAGTQIADARPAAAYAEGHVASAIHLPCSASDQVASSVLGSLAQDKLLLVYGEDTDDALRVASQIQKRLGTAGPTLAVLEGGFRAWRDAGLACASGACSECGILTSHGQPGHGEHAP